MEDFFPNNANLNYEKKDNLKALNLYTAVKSAHFFWEEG